MALGQNTTRIAKLLGTLVVLLMVFGVILTKTEVGKSALARQIESQFNSRFNGDFSIQRLDGNLLKDLFASGISLSDSSGTEIITVDSAVVRASWLDILSNDLSISSIELFHPSISLQKSENGKWNLEEVFARASGQVSDGWTDLSETNIKIYNGDLDIVNGSANRALSGLSTSINLKAIDGTLHADVLEASFEDAFGIGIDNLTGSASVNSSTFKLSFVNLKSDRSFISTRGTLSLDLAAESALVERITFEDLELESTLEASILSKLFSIAYMKEGLSLEARCDGEFAIVSCSNGFVQYADATIPFSSTLNFENYADSLIFRIRSNKPDIPGIYFPEEASRYLAQLTQDMILSNSEYEAEGSILNRNGNWKLGHSRVTARSQNEAASFLADIKIRSDSTESFNISSDIDFENLDATRLEGISQSNLSGRLALLSRVSSGAHFLPRARIILGNSTINNAPIDSANVSFDQTKDGFSGLGTIWTRQGSLRFDAKENNKFGDNEIQLELVTNNLDPSLAFVLGQNESSWSGQVTSSLSFRGKRDNLLGLVGKAEILLQPSWFSTGNRKVNLNRTSHQMELSRSGDLSLFSIDGEILQADLEARFQSISPKQQFEYWSTGIQNVISRHKRKKKYPGDQTGTFLAQFAASPPDDSQSSLSGSILMKDLKIFLPQVEEGNKTAELNLDLKSKGSNLAIRGSLETENLQTSILTADRMLASFDLQSSSNLMIETDAAVDIELEVNGAELSSSPSMDLNLVAKGRGSDLKLFAKRLDVEQQMAEASIQIRPSNIHVDIDDFSFVSQYYDWRLEPGAGLVVYTDGIQFNQLSFSEFASLGASQKYRQSVILNGGLFENKAEQLSIKADAFSLNYLSDVWEPKHPFGGVLNADLKVSKSEDDFGAEGIVTIDSLSLREFDIGDLRTSFALDPERSDRIVTNGTLTQSRNEGGNVRNNDLSFSGFLPTNSDPDNPIDIEVGADVVDLFFFDLMFYNELKNSAGHALGTGQVGGTYSRPIFNADLECINGSVTTKEYLVDYTLSGPFKVDEFGFVLEEIEVKDQKGGIAIVDGRIDFNDYEFFDYQLDISANEIQFINVGESDAESNNLPFYGFISGSGELKLTGPQSSTTLRGDNLTTTPESEIFIPITDEELITDKTFIVYADSTGAFPDLNRKRKYFIEDRPETERSFVDGMDMYLNIDAPQGSQIHLVFDALLGDVVDATGSGQIQITSEGGEFFTFGTFVIDSGEYLFTASEFFARKFNLLDGGTISWDGDPLNANLNLPASYQTRASLAGLAGYTAQQRVPLVISMDLTGRVQSPLVDLSLSLDRSDRTWQGSIDGIESIINRPDLTTEYATSVLLTNTFLLTTNQQGNAITNVADEILFNSVSHLVMSQLNRFLSEALNLDFNVGVEQRNDLEQYDLTYGFALRLADERLVIRGEGVYERLYQGGGAGSSVNEGLQGAFILEYKLNPSVAVEFFYRREGDLLEYTSPIGTSYGAGLVYQNEFSNWREFRKRIRGTLDNNSIPSQTGTTSSGN